MSVMAGLRLTLMLRETSENPNFCFLPQLCYNTTNIPAATYVPVYPSGMLFRLGRSGHRLRPISV